MRPRKRHPTSNQGSDLVEPLKSVRALSLHQQFGSIAQDLVRFRCLLIRSAMEAFDNRPSRNRRRSVRCLNSTASKQTCNKILESSEP